MLVNIFFKENKINKLLAKKKKTNHKQQFFQKKKTIVRTDAKRYTNVTAVDK